MIVRIVGRPGLGAKLRAGPCSKPWSSARSGDLHTRGDVRGARDRAPRAGRRAAAHRPAAAQADRRPHPAQPRAAGRRCASDLDAVLISHAHLDHLDVPSLRLIDRRTPVVAPRGVGRPAAAARVRAASRWTWGTRWRSARPERRRRGRPPARARERQSRRTAPAPAIPSPPEAPALGYVVAGGLSAYFAGDTGLYDGMRDLAPIDVAVLPVGGWGPRLPSDHLNPLSAAKALELLRPTACVPVHWGTLTTRRGSRRPSTPSGASGHMPSRATRAPGAGGRRARPAAGRDDRVHAGRARQRRRTSPRRRTTACEPRPASEGDARE